MTATRRVLVISPHFDDVPLALGQSLLDGALSQCRVEVGVAFSRTNWTQWIHPTPSRARLVGAWRRVEEGIASLRFGYRWRTGGFRESVLRSGTLDTDRFIDPDLDLSGDPLIDEIEAWIRRLVRTRSPRPDLLLVAAGLGGHVDHRLVALAGRRLADDGELSVGFYEDRPYTSYLDPDARGRQLPGLGADAEAVDVSGPVTDRTQRWVRRCYPSQMDEYFVEAMELDRAGRAVERVWFARGGRPEWFAAPAPAPSL